MGSQGVGAGSVLIVDDDCGTREIYTQVLSLSGYDVVNADGGRGGLELVRSREFGLLLTDLHMLDFSGLELLAETRECAPRLPVIVYTALGSPALEAAALRLGAVRFSNTLWDLDDVLQVVAHHLASPSLSCRDPYAGDDEFGPSTRRWVANIIAVTRLHRDIATVAGWAHEVAQSVTSIKRSCAACGVRASDSLDFGRALRVVIRHGGRRIDWFDTFDIVDPATMSSFQSRAGFAGTAALPDVSAFLAEQRFITNSRLLAAAAATLSR